MPTSPRKLHAFDVRSMLLFASLTLGGTTAVTAQTPSPSQAAPAATSTAQTITPSEIFMRADSDRDGQLSRQEAEHLPSVAEQFDQWDRDGNGQLSMEEFLLNVQQPK